MGMFLNSGNEAFRISAFSEIYVDKSELISFVNSRLGQEKRFLCVSRPRRFGKSMAANMLCAYYDRGCDSKDLFSNLKISEDASYEKYLNQFDVIFLNIQKFLRKAGSPENLVHYVEEKVLDEIKEAYGQYIEPDETSLPDALETVFAKDTRQQKGFVFIIDEWDCIFRETKEHTEAQKQYLDFLRDLFKDRTYVKLAYMTGILPIKKYGTHSALNIFDEFSMTNPKRLAKFVGFTESEVKQLCRRYNMNFAEAKRWYDGYRFKRAAHVYNPKSIVDAMLEEDFTSYWTSTETYEALQIYIDLDMDGLKQAIISMIGGSGYKVDIGSFQNDMTSFRSRDDVLTLLVHLGYLAYDEDAQMVYIPNEEVKAEFIRAIKNGNRPELVKAILTSDQLLAATLRRDNEAVARLIDEVHSANTSPDFYNNEQALRSIIQLAYYSSKDEFFMIQELPGGLGYADIVLMPRKNCDKPAIVVELKWDKSAVGAIEQVREKRYAQVLDGYGGEILLVGINYDKKSKRHECVIETHRK